MSFGQESATARSAMNEILADAGSEATYDDLLRRLAFHRLILKGLDSLDEPRKESAEVRRSLDLWQSA